MGTTRTMVKRGSNGMLKPGRVQSDSSGMGEGDGHQHGKSWDG